MLIATRVLLTLLGVSAIVVGLMFAIIGPNTTAHLFGSALGLILGPQAYVGGLEPVNADSEIRVLAVFFVAYGALVLWLSPRLESHKKWVYYAIGLYFAGGITRLFSLATVGWPDPLFILLATIEIVGPIVAAVLFTLGLRARA